MDAMAVRYGICAGGRAESDGTRGDAYTTIDLCLSLFSWARFRRAKAAIKLHTLIDVRGAVPCFINLTDGKGADVHVLDELELEAGSFYVMDRGYVDWARLYTFVLAGAFFVIRQKRNSNISRLCSRAVDKSTGLRCDQTVWLRNEASIEAYPDKLRRIGYRDPKTGRVLVFLTNNFDLPPLSIAQLYKLRWRVELFFKWIKSHLRIKAFLGTSRNAVLTQVWTAMCAYLIVAIMKKELALPQSLYTILQVLGTHSFSQVPVDELFRNCTHENNDDSNSSQLMLSLF